MKELKEIASNWSKLGESDPYWAVLTYPQYINNKWDKRKFYKTGEAHFTYVMQPFKDHIQFPINKVLDFGCGPGRLTFQFAKVANSVIGVDISKPMIDLAIETKLFEDKCTFHVNDRDDLSIIESDSVDLVFSFITLQHNPPKIVEKYLREFMRVSKRNKGKILFNMVTSPPLYYKIAHKLLSQKGLNLIRRSIYRKAHTMEMNWLSDQKIQHIFSENGFKLLKKEKDISVGEDWKSFFYLFEKA